MAVKKEHTTSRPAVLSIAGFDPSAGAGLLADIKTFESHKVYGLGVCTAVTIQNHAEFDELQWISLSKVLKQIDVLFRKYDINYVKIGLVINLNILNTIIDHLYMEKPNIKIIWDPILKASSGYEFHKEMDREQLFTICRKLALITPNMEEMHRLIPHLPEEEAGEYLAECCPVLLKGGHRDEHPIDLLFQKGKTTEIYNGKRVTTIEKHGTGCVLSSAILANMANGENLVESCRLAKKYITGFIASNDSALGYHLKNYHLSIAN